MRQSQYLKQLVAASLKHLLQLRFWRGQLPSSHKVSESTGLVRAITKGLVGRVPATAEPDRGPSRQAKGLTFGIEYLEVALYPDRSVVIDCYFRGHHFFPRRTESMPILAHSDKHKCTPHTPPSFCMNVKRKELQKKHFVND